ncbi:MAG: choice-of-anchor D domain-containing protein [Acidobacteriaceae bacterium]
MGPAKRWTGGKPAESRSFRAYILTAILFFGARATLSDLAAWGQQPALPVQQAASGKTNTDRRAAPFLARRRPGNAIPALVLFRARAAHAAMIRAQATPLPSTTWLPVGPSQVSTAAWNLVTGPVTSLAADPSDPSGNTVYLGSDGGGVWKSTNAAGSAAGVSFIPLTDTLSEWSVAALSSLSIGAITVQPGGTNVILAGTGDPSTGNGSWYGAGILRSADGGKTWDLIVETDTGLNSPGLPYSFLGSAFAGFAWSTTSPDLVVAAVTESGNAGDVGTWSNTSPYGLYYSPDAGVSWQLATIEDGTQIIQTDQYSDTVSNPATSVVWNPVRSRFYAAVRFHGYYESTDGMTWTRLANQPGTNLTTTLCPPNPKLSGSPACPIFQGVLAVQPVTGDMFALTVDQNNLDQGLWRDVCHVTSGGCSSSIVQFGTRISDQSLETPAGSGTIAQADYDFWLAAVPSQQDTLLFAGTQDIFRCSLANSCAWRNATNTQTCTAAQVAPAQHAVDTTFGATGLLYFGNDAGLWRSTDAVNQQAPACSSDDPRHFQNLNAGLGSLAQVENFAEDPNNPSTWLAALGGLGTAAPASAGTAWDQVLDGEGDGVAIDPVNPANWYATSEFGVGINRCTEGTSCNTAGFGNVAIGEAQVDNDFQTIPAPWILDPQNTADVIVGTCRVWRGPATGVGWSQLNLLSTMLDKGQGSSCDGNAEINVLAGAPVTSGSSAAGAEQLYAGMAGALDGGGLVPGHVFTAAVNRTATSTTKWVDLTSSPVTNTGVNGEKFNSGGFGISGIFADPHDPTGQTIYVTIQGISSIAAYSPILYRSTDAGAHWTDISSNLPAAPANSVLVDPNNANIVYVALDIGVYVTQDVGSCASFSGGCWNVDGSGLPNAPVMSLMSFNQGDTQMLRAATWGRGIWQVDLATAGIAPTAATILPASLTFPGQQLQTVSAVQTLTLADAGSLNLNITSVSIAGDFVETDNCSGQSLAPQGTCQVSVRFDPSQSGARTGLLTVFGNVNGGQLTVALAGTGLAPASMVLTPSSLTFTATTIGSPSSPQYVTIANTGGEPSTLTSETVTGDYSVSANTCAKTLAANNSCTLGIVFAPTASGTRNGTLTVTDSVGTQTAPLTGTGQAPATDALSPSSLTFAAQQVGTVSTSQQITLTNSGDQLLTGIAIAATGDFTAVNNCGTTLQGNGSCSIAVSYVPTIAGAESGSLAVTDEFRKQTVALGGTGVAPPGASALPASANFGGYAVGTTSSAQIVTVTNSGGYALTSLAAVVTSGFALATNNCPATLAVTASCQLGVTFTAAAAGAATGTLTISAANLPAVLTVALSGQGDDFSIAVSGSSSAILTSGQTATFALQLQGLGGTSGSVAVACTGAPQYATCSLNPASIAITGLNSSSVTASIATGVTTTSSSLRSNPPWKTMLRVLVLVVPLGLAGIRRRKSAQAMLLLAILAIALAGCGVGASNGSGGGGGGGGSGGGGGGGGGGTQNQTPSGTYTLTITGTMSNIAHSSQVTVTVQ